MKLDPNMSLACVYEAHGDCLKEDCGCGCHEDAKKEEDAAT